MMQELINREQAGKNICKYCASGAYCKEDDCMVYRGLRDTPTIQIETEVRNGRWLNMTKGIPMTEKQLNSYSFAGCCSVCGKNSGTQYQAMRFNFCPNCGAKMDGGWQDATD